MANRELKHISRELIHEFTEYEAMLLHDFKMSKINYMEIREKLYFRYCHYKPIFCDNSRFLEGGKMGLRNNLFGTVLIPPIFDEIPQEVPKGCYAIAILNRKYGLVKADGKGSVIFPFEYDFMGEMGLGEYLGVYEVLKGDKWGIVSVCRDIVRVEVEPVYDFVEHEMFSDFTLLKKDGKCGLWSYDSYIPPLYDDIFVPEVLGWVLVKHKGQWGYLDANLQFTTDKEEAYVYNERT